MSISAIGTRSERGRCLRKTTEIMHAHIGNAVVELRRRLNWSQEDLADKMRKHGRPLHGPTVCKWEKGKDSPSPENRMVLAKLSTKEGHEDLAALFRAPIVAWRLVALLPRTDERQGPVR